jgi:hypothetical protein
VFSLLFKGEKVEKTNMVLKYSYLYLAESSENLVPFTLKGLGNTAFV